MKYYPIFLDIKDRDCLVVGGGAVGFRKAVALEKCGAKVTVVSDRFSDQFEALTKTNICLKKKEYEKKDVNARFLVFAATHNADLNQQIKKHASMLNILCNVADGPDESDFILPSTMERGDLVLAVSTSGTSPAMAKKIRQDLEKQFGPEYAKFLFLMGNIRKKLLSAGHAPDEHGTLFHALVGKNILGLIQANDDIKINSVLHDVLGEGYAYEDLVSSRSNE